MGFKKTKFIVYPFFPFTIIIQINNFLLKFKSVKKSKKIKTICIGNIYLGGTGKTPITIKLFEILKKLEMNVAVGKKTYESQLDEQILLKNKTNFITSKTRKEIIKKAIHDQIELIIFDDGLQDRKVSYDLQFVCFDSSSWVGNGFLIPSGPLREKLSSLKKYDAVFLKDNNLSNLDELVQSIKNVKHQIKIFKVLYKIKNFDQFDLNEKYLIFSGIGNPKSFKNLLIKNNFNIIDELIYSDHFKYSKKDIDFFKNRAKSLGAKLITTEKDYTKIPEEYKDDIGFLKLELEIDNEKELTSFIKYRLNEPN